MKNIKVMREKFDIAVSEGNLNRAAQITKDMIEEYGIENTEVIKIKTELDMEKSFEEEE